MRIEFKVEGRPPRQKQGTSMWSNPSEAPLAADLRMEALDAMNKAQLSDCFHVFVSLELTLFVPRSQLENIGDLDTFVTGVCDGLQAASPHWQAQAPPGEEYSYLNPLFREPQYAEIDPKYALLIENDSKVISIHAKKTYLDAGQEVHTKYYIVAVEEEAIS